jgi:serine/threonine-protein kinase
LRGIWDGSVRDSLRAAFAASGAPSPDTVWNSVTEALDGYGRAWTDMHHDACEARLRGEQSAEALDLRMQCLEGRRSELRALTQLLGAADREVAQHAVDASRALPSVALCADVKALMQPVRVPSDPSIRARIDAVNAQLSDAQAARDAGRLPAASVLAAKLAKDAATIGYAPLDARAQLLLGGVRDASGDASGAEQALYAALARADEGHDDRVRAHAWGDLLQIAASANRSSDAARLDALAEAAITRLGGDDALEAGRLNALATLLYGQGKFAEASAQYERVLELRKHVFGADSPQTAGSEYKLGVLARGQGKFADAIVHLRAAQTRWEKLYGPDHPSVARTLNAIGAVFLNQQKYAEASTVLADAVARGEKALGPKHPELASYLQNLAISYTLRNKFADALPYLERALALLDEKQPARMTVMASLAQAYVGVGRAAEAVPLLERAIAMRPEKEIPPRQLADMRFILATALWSSAGDRTRAKALARQAHEVYVAAGAPYAATREEIDTWLREHR